MSAVGERLRLSPRGAPTTCPWCHDDLESEQGRADIRICESCRTPTHEECAALHGGCPILGCHSALERPLCFACEEPLASAGARVCLACGHDQIRGRSVRLLTLAERSRRAPVGEDEGARYLLVFVALFALLPGSLAAVVTVFQALGYSAGAALSTWVGLGVIAAFVRRAHRLTVTLKPHRHRVTTVMRDLDEIRRQAEEARAEGEANRAVRGAENAG